MAKTRVVGISLIVVSLVLVACAPSPRSKPGRRSKSPTTTVAPAQASPIGPQVVRPMIFPVVGPVRYSDTFGAPRSGGRTHAGQDLMGVRGQVLVAAADGVLSTVRHDNSGLSGNMIRLTDDEGWVYVYIHVNNDTPGTDDGANRFEHAFVDGATQGQRVRAGEPIGYLGDSGNAEETAPHLHFELLPPDGVAVNAYASLYAASRTWLGPEQVAAAAPFGSLDSVAVPSPNTLQVHGWAIDAVVDDPVNVTVFVNGNPFVPDTAGLPRPDVNAAFPTRTGDHGYAVMVPGIVGGTHQVCVIAHNAGAGGGGSRLGCADVAVP